MNHYHNYLIIAEQRNPENSKIMPLIKQFDICSYFFENQNFFQVELIIAFAFLLFITIIFIEICYKKKYNQTEKVQKNTLGNFLINLIRILYWILANPLLLIALQGIFVFNSMYWAFSFFVSIFTICFIFFHDIILLNDYFIKQDFLSIAQKNPYILTSWVKVIQCVFSSYFYSHQEFQIGYLVICFGLSLFNYFQLQYYMVIFGKYDIDYIFHLVNALYAGFNFGLVIQYLINIYDPYNFITILILIIFMIVHINFRKWYFEQQFVNPRNIYIKLYLLLWFRELDCSDVYYMGLIINHYNHQNNKKCFLRHSSVFYSGKKFAKYTHITTKPQNLEKKKSLFIKFLAKCFIETELKTNNINDDLLLKYSELLFYQFNLINESFKYLSKITKTHNINQLLRIQQLKLLIHEKLSENNLQSFKGKLPFENILKSEELMREFNQSFLKITELQAYFWKNLLLNYISIEDTIEFCKNIMKEIKTCQLSWKNINLGNPDGCELIRFRWKFMYYFFKLYILHKKLKVFEIKQLPDINLKTQQIFQDEKVDERSSSEDEAQNKQYYVTNSIISHNSMFFRVDKKGEIIQASQLVLKILGKHQTKYKGQRIEQLMPDIIKENHNDFLKLFNKTGQSENLYRRRSIHIKHVNGYCIKAQKYLKYIFNIQSNRFEYISMIRQVQSRSQYILLNSLWEIDTLSEYLYSMFGNFKLQFLSLCPKAITYSEYSEFLTGYDMKILSLKLCSSGSRERIQDKKFTFKRYNDQTFSNKSIGELTSLVFKRELEEKQKKNVIQLFQQVLEEDNDVENVQKTQRMNHVKFNIRVPVYKSEMIEDYLKFDSQCHQIFYNGEEKVRVVTRNDNGRLRVNKTEFLQRYRWVRFQRKKFRYEKIKYLFEHYCQERFLEKVLKVDANLKFYKTLNKQSFIVIKVNRLELYDEQTNQTDKQDGDFQNVKSFKPYLSSQLQEILAPTQTNSQNVTLKSQNGYRYTGNNEYLQDLEINSNRDSSRPFLADCNLREDFSVQGSNSIYSFDENRNPFIKEEQNKLTKHNKKLSLLFLINRGSIIYQILILSLSFFLCQYYYNPLVIHDSITMLGHLYKLQIIFVQSYNYIIDVALMNDNQLTSLLISNPTTKFNTTDQFYEFVQKVINDDYVYFYYIYQNPDFVQMVYSGFYSSSTNSSGLDIIDAYQVCHTLFNQAQYNLIDFQNPILESYRLIMIPYAEELMFDSVTSRIDYGITNLELSSQNYILFVILQNSILIITITFTLIIKFNLRTDINLIYLSIVKVPKDDKILAVKQYLYLKNQIYSLIEEEQSGIKNKQTLFLKSDTIIQEPEEKEAEKLNQKRNRTQIKKLPKFRTKFVAVYIIYIILILSLFGTSYYFILLTQDQALTFFNENSFIKQTDYFWIIILLKEKFIHEKLLNQSFYSDIIKERFQEFIDDMDNINPILYQTTINQINNIFDDSLCNQGLDEQSTYIYYNKYCSSFVQGAMNRGLKQFNIQLYQVVTKALNPNDERYESFDIEDLSQYYISFQIIYEIYLNLESIWADEAKQLLNNSLQISLLLYILQLFIIIMSYILLIEFYVFSHIEKDCRFSKTFYKYFMLNQTINQVKMMRVALVKTGLLQK